ncbi:ABC transporter permease [Thermocoleostomius sinensis]|uniref:Transport permease protein n=1 Tax=Thermocoleostomius sinensis A174 TaxID=2016057 RepID=A0A9E8ZCI1_9CYAN|nr:ABC transporter permease [Thermocoleostomius sinensis]WAL60382.1 ABC transporter permease [Thermocoleostomius sinensis A174]
MNSKAAIDKGRVRHVGSHRDWENYRDLVIVLLQRELKVRYNNKLLGYLWSIANPLTSALVYFVAFGLIMRVREPNYVLVLVSGLFPWQWFSNSVGSAPNLFVGSASLIKKLNFPRNIVPLCAVLNHMIHYIASVPVIILFLYIYQQSPHWSWLYGFPILLLIQLVMVYGIALGLSSINLFFRDLERLTSIITHFLFFLTPVLYTLDRFPPQYHKLVVLMNPAAGLMVNWRQLIMEGTLNPFYVLVSMVYAALFFVIGYAVYKQLSWKFAELL